MKAAYPYPSPRSARDSDFDLFFNIPGAAVQVGVLLPIWMLLSGSLLDCLLGCGAHYSSWTERARAAN